MDKAEKASLQIKKSDKIVLFSHIDADGITSGAISLKSILDYDKNKDVVLISKDTLTEEMTQKIMNMNPDTVWFSDIGSGEEYMKNIKKYLLDNKINVIITDHHNPKDITHSYLYHINPEVYGGSGDVNMSGATATYLVGKNLTKEKELIPLVITGSVGDLQAKENGKLVGMNRKVLEKGMRKGIVKKKKGFLLFARSYKSISVVLSNYFPIYVEEFSDLSKVSSILGSEIDLTDENDNWRNYDDLSDEEREKVREVITEFLLEKGVSPEKIQSCIGEYYYFPNNDKNTMMKYADEWATLINAASRGGGKPNIAVLTSLGDKESYKEAEELKKEYSKQIRDAIEYIKGVPDALSHKNIISYAILPEDFPIASTGSVAGIVGNSEFIPDNSKLMIVIGIDNESNNYHISVRKIGNYLEDLELGELLEKVGKKISDEGGGGHKDAGAMEISKNKMEVDDIIESISEEVNDIIEN
ncbi:MAG: DHH family phosphoesterase [bacterium]